jgi:hypothetical protein
MILAAAAAPALFWLIIFYKHLPPVEAVEALD